MAICTLIIGQSGTGKSASMRNLDNFALVNVNGKPLPFKRSGKNIEELASDDYRHIKKFIKETDKEIIVIDDMQYLMANEFMRRATEKGYDKFTEMAQGIWDLVKYAESLPATKRIYFLTHIESDERGNEKAKTIGKLIDEKITLEGMFTIVLKTVVKDGQFSFSTVNNGYDTVKAPMGLFKANLIDNDLLSIDADIVLYYDIINTYNEEDKAFTEAVKKREKMKSEAEEKLTDINQPYELPNAATVNEETGEVIENKRKERVYNDLPIKERNANEEEQQVVRRRRRMID